MTIHSAPSMLFLVAAWALLASAQSTTTYSTSTSWALLDNTDLFPKHTSTASPSAAVTTTANDADEDISTTTTPTTTTTGDSFQITPPIPCPGLYYTYGGVCCAGNQMLDCDYDELYEGQQEPSSCCPAGQFVWALPLSEEQIADAQSSGDYSGCPGNMRNGVCCSGGVIYRDDDAEVCSLGSVVWVAVTEESGEVVTSSVPPSSSVAATTTTTGGVRTTTSSQTGVAATGGASLGGSWAVDGRAWWGVVLMMGGAL
ncbi:hypothetical protein BFW01_g8648 [Lasiodiplodia theobromae]|uniref:Uncharacterized protein n=1 Tax=Lasiodiplodia theobromae TaxID=45133 RepID=A0A5N5DK39_9PEZI|nr:hypothetical protein DBV05_g2941 [Lasiodiplodia theobromae]KAF9637752.1 hypothetical protein BFW01_g8648 [Lasiodiplodia theobromae]